MGMILDDRIGHIVAPGLGLGHDIHGSLGEMRAMPLLVHSVKGFISSIL